MRPGRGAKSTSPSARPDPEVADDSDDSLSEKDVKQEIATYERPPPTLPARKRVHAQGKEPVPESLAFGYKVRPLSFLTFFPYKHTFLQTARV